MKKKFLTIILLGLLIFFGLVYYNYSLAQKAIKETKISPLSVTLVTYPESVQSGTTGSFEWKIDSSPDLSTSFTTIYWGYESSPSALEKTDSPQAVGYPYSEPDYAKGIFALPEIFNVRIKFDKVGKIYFRAYGRVKDDHLWSEEKVIEVTK